MSHLLRTRQVEHSVLPRRTFQSQVAQRILRDAVKSTVVIGVNHVQTSFPATAGWVMSRGSSGRSSHGNPRLCVSDGQLKCKSSSRHATRELQASHILACVCNTQSALCAKIATTLTMCMSIWNLASPKLPRVPECACNFEHLQPSVHQAAWCTRCVV